jgi:polysaccharide pyruvyl transferase WcaK-like protein
VKRGSWNYLKLLIAFAAPIEAFWAYLLALVSKGDEHSAVLLPPSNIGSLGDQALLEASSEQLLKIGYVRITYISYGEKSFPGEVLRNARIIPLRRLLDSHAVLSIYYWKELRAYLEVLRKSRLLVFIGADVLDGSYSEARSINRLRLLSLAQRLGRQTHVISCSFNASVSPSIKRYIGRRLTRTIFHVRDRLSLDRLQAFFSGAATLSADCAFLLKPQEVAHGKDILAAVHSKKGRAKVLALNISEHALDWANGIPEERLAEICQALLRLLTRYLDIDVLLVPHDTRGGETSDRNLLLKIRSIVIDQGLSPSRFIGIAEGLGPGEIKALVGEADFCVSGRMHLAIACLGGGVPVACFPYNDKFEGLFEHFGLDDCLIPSVAANSGHELGVFLENFLLKSSLIQSRIAERLPQVVALAKSNFAFSPVSKSKERYYGHSNTS